MLRICHLRLARAAFLVIAVGSISLAGVGKRQGAVEAERLPQLTLTISADGIDRHFTTSQTTVVAVLKDAGIDLGPLDRAVPALKDRVSDGAKITITRISDQIVPETHPITFDTVKAFSTSLRPGQVKQTRQGVSGQRLLHYRVRSENGVQVSRTRISSILVKRPVNAVATIGSRGRYTSRGMWRTARVMNMSASAYDPGPRSCGPHATGRTACGLRAGYGYAVAGDKGSAIKGSRIDLGFNSNHEAMHFGRKRVTVHVLQE